MYSPGFAEPQLVDPTHLNIPFISLVFHDLFHISEKSKNISELNYKVKS